MIVQILPQYSQPVMTESVTKVYIEVTNRCNSPCQSCIRTFNQREPLMDLSYEKFVYIMERLPATQQLILHGIGEPLLNRELPRMIAYAKARGIYVLFNSNAIICTPAWQERLVRSGLDEYRISCDAGTAPTYHRLRGVPAFEKVIGNAAGMVETKARLHAQTPKLSLWFTGMKENLAELPELMRIAHRIGVPEVHLQRLVFFGKGTATAEQSFYNDHGTVEQAMIAECEQLSRTLGLVFSASGATAPADMLAMGKVRAEGLWHQCYRPWTTTYITANGNVLPCCMSPWITRRYDDIILGNVFDDVDPLADPATAFEAIWNGPGYQAFRRRHLSDDPPQVCINCGSRWSL